SGVFVQSAGDEEEKVGEARSARTARWSALRRRHAVVCSCSRQATAWLGVPARRGGRHCDDDTQWCVRAVGRRRGREGRRGEECPHGEVVGTATTTRSGVFVQSAGDEVEKVGEARSARTA